MATYKAVVMARIAEDEHLIAAREEEIARLQKEISDARARIEIRQSDLAAVTDVEPEADEAGPASQQRKPDSAASSPEARAPAYLDSMDREQDIRAGELTRRVEAKLGIEITRDMFRRDTELLVQRGVIEATGKKGYWRLTDRQLRLP